MGLISWAQEIGNRGQGITQQTTSDVQQAGRPNRSLADFAFTSEDSIISADNPGSGEIFSFEAPEAMVPTAYDLGMSEQLAEEAEEGAERASEFFENLTTVSDSMAKVQEAHTKFLMKHATNQRKQIGMKVKIAEHLYKLQQEKIRQHRTLGQADDRNQGNVDAVSMFQNTVNAKVQALAG